MVHFIKGRDKHYINKKTRIKIALCLMTTIELENVFANGVFGTNV